MDRTFEPRQICAYINAMDGVATEWERGFANAPKFGNTMYWLIFTKLYLRSFDEKAPIQRKELINMLPSSRATITRKLDLAKERGFILMDERTKSPYIELAEKTIHIVEVTCSEAMRQFGLSPARSAGASFTASEICQYLYAVDAAAGIWFKSFPSEPELHATNCWKLFSSVYIDFCKGLPALNMSDAKKQFLEKMSEDQTQRIIEAAQRSGYLTGSGNDPGSEIAATEKLKALIETVSSSAMNEFSTHFNVDLVFGDDAHTLNSVAVA